MSASTSSRFALVAGSLLAATGVACGAIGSHLIGRDPGSPWQIAVQYQLWHAIGLIAIAALPGLRSRLPALLLTAGTLLFSGSLYLLALGVARWMGPLTPLGGMLLIAGWLLLGWQALRRTR